MNLQTQAYALNYLGAEHSDGAVEGGVDVGVIIAAHGSKPRLKHRTLCL